MIPKIVHFIFGLTPTFGNRGFSYIHYLAVQMAHKLINPDTIYFHYEYEPNGMWWEKIKPSLKLNKINAPDNIFGNPIISYQHKADVLRLEILKDMGGIYLDIDIIALNPFDKLLNYKNVMGVEPSVGLCNAVILSEKGSEFISTWYASYKTFSKDRWNYHSIQLPMLIAQKMIGEVKIESYYSFYYPFYKDTAHYYLWGVKQNKKNTLTIFSKNVILSLYRLLPGSDKKYVPILHQFNSSKWHLERMDKSYCLHLWETLWWDKYLKGVNHELILNGPENIFSKLIRKRLTDDEISGNI